MVLTFDDHGQLKQFKNMLLVSIVESEVLDAALAVYLAEFGLTAIFIVLVVLVNSRVVLPISDRD